MDNLCVFAWNPCIHVGAHVQREGREIQTDLVQVDIYLAWPAGHRHFHS